MRVHSVGQNGQQQKRANDTMMRLSFVCMRVCDMTGTRQSSAILSHRFVRIILIQFITGRLMCTFYACKRQRNLFCTLRFIHSFVFASFFSARCRTRRKLKFIHWKINRRCVTLCWQNAHDRHSTINTEEVLSFLWPFVLTTKQNKQHRKQWRKRGSSDYNYVPRRVT